MRTIKFYIHVIPINITTHCLCIDTCGKKVWEWKEPVGFLDLHVVSLQTIEADPSFVEKYIAAALLHQVDKKYIVVPYNEG